MFAQITSANGYKSRRIHWNSCYSLCSFFTLFAVPTHMTLSVSKSQCHSYLAVRSKAAWLLPFWGRSKSLSEKNQKTFLYKQTNFSTCDSFIHFHCILWQSIKSLKASQVVFFLLSKTSTNPEELIFSKQLVGPMWKFILFCL